MSTFVGRRVPAATLRLTREPLRLPLWLMVPWWLLKLLWRLLLRLAGAPVLLAALTAMTATWAVCQLVSPLPAFAVLLIVAALLVDLRFRRPAAFQRWIYMPLRARWRGWSIYRHKWPATMDFAGLTKTRKDGTQFVPVLLGVKATIDVDRVRARMLAGQTVDDWAKVSDRLGQTFGSLDVRVHAVPGRPHDVELLFLINDPLTEVVEPFEQEVPVDLTALSVGLAEDGTRYRLRLLGNHVLLAGRTDYGKSSGAWAIVWALAPCIADGTVRLIGIDPKRDELSFGELLFSRLAYRNATDFAAVLEEAVTIMQARQDAMHGISRQHVPTRDEPLIVVFIDELAALVYVNDRDTRKRIESALGLLLSQGRAVGISVVGCVQDPRKETVPARGLFTVRCLLAVNESDEVELVLARGAYDRGARADKITIRGVAFVEVDGQAEPVRVRFCHVTDDHITALCGGWRPETFEAVPAEELLAEIEAA